MIALDGSVGSVGESVCEPCRVQREGQIAVGSVCVVAVCCFEDAFRRKEGEMGEDGEGGTRDARAGGRGRTTRRRRSGRPPGARAAARSPAGISAARCGRGGQFTGAGAAGGRGVQERKLGPSGSNLYWEPAKLMKMLGSAMS